MPNEKPSYMTSTFSIVTLVVSVGLVALCVWTKNVDVLERTAMLVLGAYGVKKGQESMNGGKPA